MVLAPSKQGDALTRVVFLGASNLARGMPTLVQIARRRLAGPIEFLVAGGLGRSYGQSSRFLTRERVGILRCGLWDALSISPRAQSYALVADVGNDLVYGASPSAIEGWVEDCLERLGSVGFRAILLGLPLPSLRRLSQARYVFFRTLFFPSHRPSRADVLEQAEDLQERLRSLASKHRAAFVELDASWYGFDPIHLSPLRSRGAWQEILARWGAVAGGSEPGGFSSNAPVFEHGSTDGRRDRSGGRRKAGALSLWLRAGVVGELFGPRGGELMLEDGSRVALF
jgi:hypothetical protein